MARPVNDCDETISARCHRPLPGPLSPGLQPRSRARTRAVPVHYEGQAIPPVSAKERASFEVISLPLEDLKTGYGSRMHTSMKTALLI
ncbi:hypothetical protein EVAR_40485_1 [Eumeta japonica]|uniref:Uncharacterized protein n=1 Tax=Eumeta variegata TaxID=151549 RepID=A0A4C1XYE8_EUMVA|nr:hypothetical protein EVAR_40485_1 [Eumeta japonica]